MDFVLDHLQFEEPMGKTIHITEQPRTIDWSSNQDQANYPKAVRLQQSKWLI